MPLGALVTRRMNTAKRMDTTVKTIATHDGSFHCDEALAIFLLRLLPQYKGKLLSNLCLHLTVKQTPRSCGPAIRRCSRRPISWLMLALSTTQPSTVTIITNGFENHRT